MVPGRLRSLVVPGPLVVLALQAGQQGLAALELPPAALDYYRALWDAPESS